MDVTKYRKLYLQKNWGDNEFIMIQEKVNRQKCFCSFDYQYSINFQMSHPKVLSGEAYWITHDELCIGYELRKNSEIYRPIFSYSRQKLLNNVNKNIISPKKFWNKVKIKYFIELYRNKMLSVDCINYIIMFIL